MYTEDFCFSGSEYQIRYQTEAICAGWSYLK